MGRLTYDVAIIGSGSSGLAAAHTLCTELGYRVVVIEARNRLGGSIDTYHTSNHYPIDVGMKYIQIFDSNTIPNPALAIAQTLGLNIQLTDSSKIVTYNQEGEPQSFLEDPKIFSGIKAITMLTQEAKAIYKHEHQKFPNLAQVMQLKEDNLPKPGTEEFTVVQLLNAMVTHNTGARPNDISLLELLHTPANNYQNALIEGGMQQLIDRLFEKINQSQKLLIELNTPITEIHHDPEEETNRLVTLNNNEFRAKTILCTVPLGVLKEGDIQFYPPLSRQKQTAIQDLKPGLMNVVVLEFEKPFWPLDAQFIYPGHPNIHIWPEYLNMYHFSNQKTATLVCHYYGEEALFQKKE